MITKKIRLFAKNIVFTFIVVALFFCLMEMICRILGLGVNTGAGILEKTGLFKFKVINRKGQVDRDVFIETGPRVYPISQYKRSNFNNVDKVQKEEHVIVTIGDSCTYGLEMKEDETFPCFLETILNSYSIDKKFRVFNFGWPGYASSQGSLFLEKYIENIQPDMVIAWFGANDGAYAPFCSDKEFYYRKNHKLVKLHNFFYTHLRFYRILRNLNLRYFQELVDKSFKNPFDGKHRKRRVSPEDFKYNLMKMKRICEENNCRVLFIWHCWLFDGELKKHKEYKPITPYLDLCDIYSLKKESVKEYFADYCHPSSEGHKIIAEEIAKRILDHL
ncbi:MAG: SGNH/GDSL hydrolase family protein [Candidatus Omnitrophota bacterium]|nr:MAG: SGNH/GDSL hydrolase family protein [Candidatus Omnitrophota bacterium]